MVVVMIVWMLAMWFLIRSAGLSATPPRAVQGPLLPEPAGNSDEADARESMEADLVFARLTGQLDVTAYQEAMAALAASTATRSPGSGRNAR